MKLVLAHLETALIADHPRIARTAARAGDGGRGGAAADARDVDGALGGRGDAVALERFAPLLAHPVGRPGVRQAGFDTDLVAAVARPRLLDVLRDFAHGRAAGVCGRDDHDTGLAIPGHVPHHAQIHHGQHGDLRIGNLLQPGIDLVGGNGRQRVHHHVAEFFGVLALASTAVGQMVGGGFVRHGQRGFFQHFPHVGEPRLAQGGQLTADAASSHVLIPGVVGE
ncbi:hypothetical protein G6F57_017233 [Rhizopus arrhizus]|nr:hypothetical protein G6F57_017233 [Rhizopus arrhizus]